MKKTTVITFSLMLAATMLSSCKANKATCSPAQAADYQQTLQPATPGVNPPIMGWSSWNNFRVNISEDIIKAQADAMASNGMADAGYEFINIDDGFFGGRDEQGNLLINTERFPNGLKPVADHIHSLGLKAGIYSDGGMNTCGSVADGETAKGTGVGLLGHDLQDLDTYLNKWGFDFLKVDWCGGAMLGLNHETRYKEIGANIRRVKPETVFNICCWGFPGAWAPLVADSWRIYGDIDPTFESVCTIIDHNADLWQYCGPGHYNDMDMLQVGRGMTPDEDRAHFSMWCMMVSPLLAGNDLTDMTPETLAILTNKEMLEIHHDPFYQQARRLTKNGNLEMWGKPLIHSMSGDVAVALFNRSDAPADISLDVKLAGIDPAKGYTMREIWTKTDHPLSTRAMPSFSVPAHGVVILRIKGTSIPNNKYQRP